MDIKKNLYSKTGVVLEKLSLELLLVEVSERIPKIQDLSTKFEVGRGTIQAALKMLEQTGCIVLESKGHLGTFLRKKNWHELLKLAGVERVFGVMPLPYSKKYEGLATAFHNEINQLGLPLSIAFMSGADARLKEVSENRYDFTLASKFSATQYMNGDQNLMIALEFGSESYLSKHGLITVKPIEEIERPMKIGIDSFSIDQRLLTLAEFKGQDVELVEQNYMHLTQCLLTGEIDGAIWNVDEFVHNQTYYIYPLSSQLEPGFNQMLNEAVCVIRKDNELVQYLLEKLSVSRMRGIQEKVEKGLFSPKY